MSFLHYLFGLGSGGASALGAPVVVTVSTPTMTTAYSSASAYGGMTVYHTGGPLSPSAGVTSVGSLFVPQANTIYSSSDSRLMVLDNLSIGFDEGKTLSFHEINPPSYGMPSWMCEDWIELKLNLTGTEECYFRGKIKTTSHVGDNNAEEIKYTVHGVPQLSDEVQVLGPSGEGYLVEDITSPTTLTMNGDIIPAVYVEPVLLRDAVTSFFGLMAADLEYVDLSADFDITGISTIAVVEATTTQITGGFFTALKELVSHDPGVKPWYDDTDSTWKFVRAIDSDPIVFNVEDTPLLAHEWEQSTEDRYTAIELYENGEAQTANLPVSTYDLVPGWDQTLESSWTYNNAASQQDAYNEDPTPIQKVYREWILTQPVGAIHTGTPVKLHYKLPGYNGTTHPFLWGEVQGQITIPKPPARTFLGPGEQVPRPIAVIRTVQPVVVAGNPYVPGSARAPLPGQVAATYYQPQPIGGTGFIRYPATGFEGTAYTLLGIERIKRVSVPAEEMYAANAATLLRLYKDILIRCSLPIYGDPMERMLRALEGRVCLQHLTNTTGLEDAMAVISGYEYDFRESTGTLQLSTDIGNFIRKEG